jgi:hypothetical protein
MIAETNRLAREFTGANGRSSPPDSHTQAIEPPTRPIARSARARKICARPALAQSVPYDPGAWDCINGFVGAISRMGESRRRMGERAQLEQILVVRSAPISA